MEGPGSAARLWRVVCLTGPNTAACTACCIAAHQSWEVTEAAGAAAGCCWGSLAAASLSTLSTPCCFFRSFCLLAFCVDVRDGRPLCKVSTSTYTQTKTGDPDHVGETFPKFADFLHRTS